jgi:hypothetical protein
MVTPRRHFITRELPYLGEAICYTPIRRQLMRRKEQSSLLRVRRQAYES